MLKAFFSNTIVLYTLVYPLVVLLTSLSYLATLIFPEWLVALFSFIFLVLPIAFVPVLLMAQLQHNGRRLVQSKFLAVISILISLATGPLLFVLTFQIGERLYLGYYAGVFQAKSQLDFPKNPQDYYYFVYPNSMVSNLTCSKNEMVREKIYQKGGGGTRHLEHRLALQTLSLENRVFLTLVNQNQPYLVQAGQYFRRQTEHTSFFTKMARTCMESDEAVHLWELIYTDPLAARQAILKDYLSYLFLPMFGAFILAWLNHFFAASLN